MGNAKHWLIVNKSGEVCEDQTKLRCAAYLLSTLSNPERLAIIMRLSRGERQLSELMGDLGLKSSLLSTHLALLRRGGLIATRRESKHTRYGLTESGVEVARFVRAVYQIGDVRRVRG